MPHFELHTTFCENVKRRRKALGLTQVEIADRLGVSQPSYAQVESGRREPSLGLIQRVAAALEIEPAELLCHNLSQL